MHCQVDSAFPQSPTTHTNRLCWKTRFFTAALLTCHSRESTGVTNNTNDGSAPLQCCWAKMQQEPGTGTPTANREQPSVINYTRAFPAVAWHPRMSQTLSQTTGNTDHVYLGCFSIVTMAFYNMHLNLSFSHFITQWCFNFMFCFWTF